MTPKRSILALFLQIFGWITIGLFTPIYVIFSVVVGDKLSLYEENEGLMWLVTYLMIFILGGIGLGSIFIFLGNLIQKIWNIESYLKTLAQNSSPVITDYPTKRYEEKPIDALKAAVKPPAKPESDMSKYAPK